MTATPSSTLRQRLFAFLLAGIGGTAAAAVSFAMSLHDAANPPGIAAVGLGDPIDTGRWTVTLHGARSGTLPPTGVPPFDPKKFVMVDLDVTNRSATPNNVLYRLLTPEPPVPNLPLPVYYLARDNWFASYINPDMPERVIAVWEWPEAAPLPERLKLKVSSQIYKQRDNLYGASGWYDRDPVAEVEMPVVADPKAERPQ
ncbi:hypothetical protein RB623_12435 [Mesorhizobium sp. LHD-90]|uniref:hypothetical protein n=1 Tax=Mesorhizobium sp. LHD-90 TaxID=3071414 RepID=UPI0027E1C648|nr:hypothetical protein [Mesorhizobium sp. LHD-90]MDQ6434856.1 hypothetical protein [Mesorhizobium sp. LHD-90]